MMEPIERPGTALLIAEVCDLKRSLKSRMKTGRLKKSFARTDIESTFAYMMIQKEYERV